MTCTMKYNSNGVSLEKKIDELLQVHQSSSIKVSITDRSFQYDVSCEFVREIVNQINTIQVIQVLVDYYTMMLL